MSVAPKKNCWSYTEKYWAKSVEELTTTNSKAYLNHNSDAHFKSIFTAFSPGRNNPKTSYIYTRREYYLRFKD
jgi:hypothetical protein